MLYLNQLLYGHIAYEHNIDRGGASPDHRNVGTSGCGLCCACMAVEHLTTQTLSLEECVQLAYASGANRKIGTRMEHLGPALAERFGLCYRATDRLDELLLHLQNGGEAAINVGGDHDDHVGLFSDVGHYVLAVAYDGESVCMLDPAYEPGRYEKEGRRGKVRVCEPFAYCSPEDLAADTTNRENPFHLFCRNKPE